LNATVKANATSRPAKATASKSRSPSQINHQPKLTACALKLGKHAHHLKRGFAGRRRGVEPLLMQEKVDPQRVQLG
jgi:hypothetical protein